MHLKALTLRGFKSFASATTLRFEPGITCVVGPNGSGKSNVVDALSWVMGEQGAKSLRGGKMEDVIFAGTTGRPPLGRAEVSLTIDNSDGALPIEYAEVTITRIMFRNGGSEYQINGDTCRLLDIQELLSDSGIGREMHVIVGQGQLDSVLHADPMGRRAFIEEAAGVLKHRKRKEKALRKLDAMGANLARVQDLTDELRRQLKPLGRQAAVARRAAVIQADLRDARLRLLADDLVTLRVALRDEIADEAELKKRKDAAEAELRTALAREAELEGEVRRLAPRLQLAQQTWYELSQLAERVRGTVSLADARVRSASEAPAEERRGRDPEDLEREAARIREQEAELTAALEAAEHALEDTVAHRADLERELAAEERRLKDAARAIADRREGLARLNGQVNAARGRAASAQAEIDRLAASRDEAQERAASAQELGEPAGLVSEYGPDQLVPPSPAAEGEELPEDPDHPRNRPKAYLRAEQEKRLRSAERAYQQLGKVNPLALEEFSALEERHKFLSEQLEDLKKTRADLLQVIKEVDERVEQVFTEAYRDTAREFEGVFSRLFPGGEGRLVLTDPGNMLATGVDVEARPPGKKVKRLSLLSGGERSLTAVALLVAIFKARPSPFYVMDEVEAALDDTNLQRLIRIMAELPGELPADRDHPPEADDGGRRRAVRRVHAG
ncbi:Chromosome partition protein Smc [Streptomyces griseus subsp. griseus]